MATSKFPLLTTQEIARMIDDCVPHERNRRILKRRLCDGVPFDVIAEEFSLTPRRIKQILREYTDTLFLH